MCLFIRSCVWDEGPTSVRGRPVVRGIIEIRFMFKVKPAAAFTLLNVHHRSVMFKAARQLFRDERL